jgi:hypothetical protein
MIVDSAFVSCADEPGGRRSRCPSLTVLGSGQKSYAVTVHTCAVLLLVHR